MSLSMALNKTLRQIIQPNITKVTKTITLRGNRDSYHNLLYVYKVYKSTGKFLCNDFLSKTSLTDQYTHKPSLMISLSDITSKPYMLK